ncbi:MAG: tRNA 2-thiocytidine biosynthesis protein TtcA [Deltaproteobacteria bacterium ADurb.BinA179]|nr:tRNA 2-thiocytidine(32) synthetase TtcA [Deltaproteobacteria bacterium]MDI9543126.1 ATP-binding protein [Pseudomonadota bacterium]NLW69155.1 tRNA 2-thiocytidine(32) synthetase TtcA [Bacteriovoracaceae bacterium]OPZ25153.1 MAG: tRNA 2-thiocytidine biosynthesis protein TtcA [Deltaproteobacteria bacterium ADurb.BinA179]HRR22024.1 ATP-binding protein [Desulfomonilia bacterium]
MNHNSRRYYEKQLRRKVGTAIHDYQMIRRGDRILVAVSGGKDSLVLLKVLADLRRSAPVEYEIMPVHLSTGFEKDFGRIIEWARSALGLEIEVVQTGISEILARVSDPEKSPCALCSRLRRGRLYTLAQERGVSSIALGHHLDDIIETFFLRCFYTGQIGAMAPARVSNDGRNRVIRPLAYCKLTLVKAYFSFFDVEPVSCSCMIRPDSKREQIREYLRILEKDNPKMKNSIFAALGNIDTKSLCLKGEYHAHSH